MRRVQSPLLLASRRASDVKLPARDRYISLSHLSKEDLRAAEAVQLTGTELSLTYTKKDFGRENPARDG